MGIDLIFLLFFSLPRRLAKRVVSTPTEKKIYYGYMLLLHYSINKNLDHSYYTCTCIHVYRISAIKHQQKLGMQIPGRWSLDLSSYGLFKWTNLNCSFFYGTRTLKFSIYIFTPWHNISWGNSQCSHVVSVLVPDFGSDPHFPVTFSTRGCVLELYHLGIHPWGEHLLFIL